jgi:hypothetical protein
MKYFPDEPARGLWARYAVAALPLLYLTVALVYSANSAPWGRQVDPESAYAMNGLAWAAGYPMMKNDHPGTTTILLVGIVIKLWTFFTGRSDVIEFGLKNYDAIIYASRAAEALILSGVLLVCGIIVRNATRSALAAMLFQVAPFVHPEALHFEVMLIPESLMVSCAILGMALVLKAALDEGPPSPGLGAAQGLAFALGLSSKYLHLPLAILGVSLLRSPRAAVAAAVAGIVAFFLFNRVLNPLVFSGGFHWLVSLATHKGVYGEGEPGFIDFNLFWPNMGEIISAAPLVAVAFLAAALVALARMLTSGRYLDPISLTLLASFLAFAVQLVAASKHFALHYIMGIDRRRSGPDRHRDPPAVSGAVAACDRRCSGAGLCGPDLDDIAPDQERRLAMGCAQQYRREAVKGRDGGGAFLRQRVRHVRASAGERTQSWRRHDLWGPGDGGPILRSLPARVQCAAARPQFLPQPAD